MPLHGKIVVIKRSGGDGTEFPLTAPCLFGRKLECDIRIQLPQVSKEHCRIDFNENQEIILTNLSSVNPTRVNGEALHQAERLKHGDVITVIDRSFRFEHPPPAKPKKRPSIGGKTETLKVQNQQVGGSVTADTAEKRTSDVSTDPHLKDGTNHENIQRPLETTVEADEQNKTASPFSDLYQMIKQSLDVKTPRKSSVTVPQTPASGFCTPRPGSVESIDETPVPPTEDKSSSGKVEADVSSVADETVVEAEPVSDGTPKSAKKQRRSFTGAAENAVVCDATSTQKRSRTPPKRFTACEVASPKSPVRGRSKEAKPEEEEAVASPKVDRLAKESPEKDEMVKVMTRKRKSEELGDDLAVSQMKRKRVSFGGFLCPELFDKRLPPNSPLQKGAAPRRSFSVSQPKQSLLRRASAVGLLQSKNGSPSSGKTSPKSRSPSPKAGTPAKKSPKSKSPSPAGGRSSSVQGRFSVSHICTPSPIAEDAASDQGPLVRAAPKVTPRRRSLSRCRSGFSRASMKVKNSWAEIVRFGQTKVKPAAPAKKTVTKKTAKKTVTKPQTPARNPCVHVGTTGHADSPVTIVVGRAHRQNVPPTGAAPKLVPNIALLKKNMKMDEDLTGISEMLKTPANEKRKTSVVSSSAKTPAGSLCTSVVEPSVLNTPEEPGEMMVSPLTVSSTVKDRSYNSEAVQRLFSNDQECSGAGDAPAAEESGEQHCAHLKNTAATPKQKPEFPECLTGVKRMMRTPRQRAEPIEDLRGNILKTPKQKPEQQECLSGVKRMMETPRPEAGPAEDVEAPQPGAADALVKTPADVPEPEDPCVIGEDPVKSSPAGERLARTPKQKSAPVEDLVGVKRLMKTPSEKGHAVEEDFGTERLVKTPGPSGGAPLQGPGETQAEASEQVEEEMPQDCEEDVAKELVFALEEPQDDVPSDVIDVPQVDKEDIEVAVDDHLEKCGAAVEETPEDESVDEKFPEEQPEEDVVPHVDPTATEPQTAPAEAAAACEEAVVPAPVRAKRGKKSDATAPPAVRHATRGRKAKPQESTADDQPEPETSTQAVGHLTSPVEEEAVAKTPRGKKSKPAPVEQSEDESLTAEAPPQKSMEKPKRGRKPKPEAVEQSEEAEDVATETKQQPPVRAKRGRTAKQEEEEKPESSLKPKRGRPTKPAEEAEQPDVPSSHRVDAADAEVCSSGRSGSDGDQSSDAVEAAPQAPEVETAAGEVPEIDAAVQKKSARGRKAQLEDKREAAAACEEAVVPAPVRAKRGKKSDATAPPAVRHATRGRKAKPQESTADDQPEPETSTQAVGHLTSPVEEEAVAKTPRGKKSKPAPVEQSEDESLTAEAPPQKSTEKPKRGRKPKPEAVEQSEEAEDVAMETKQQPPVRAKRGRTAKEEEKPESSSVETTKPQASAKKIKRTRKAEQEDAEEVQADETDVPKEAEVKMTEQAIVATKPKRGGRRTAEVQDVLPTDKLKRGKRGKPAPEEGAVTSVGAEETSELQAEEKNQPEPEAPVMKPGRAKGAKSVVKSEVPEAVPAKRARRAAAPLAQEPLAEATVRAPEPAAASVEPAKRGRRAAAKPAAAAAVDEPAAADAEDTKTSKRSGRWKAQLEVVEIPKVTPVKAVRGKKSKLGGQVDAESKTVAKDADPTEEKDLSGKAAEAQPAKKTRRGPKVAAVTADEAEATSRVESVEADSLPKTRRGKAAKK